MPPLRRAVRSAALCGAAFCGAVPALPAQSATPPARPRVHVVATGGTIASTNYYVGEAGKIGVDALLRAVPAVDTAAVVTGQQFANVASKAVTPAMWLALSRGIADTLRARPTSRAWW
jgi:L-asparaginase/Glu-tRNA(Gln) amidotransferase subunit D